MNQETIKAASDFSNDDKVQYGFLAGAEYKQQQIDELVTELKYARRYLNGFEHDVHTIDELIQKHKR